MDVTTALFALRSTFGDVPPVDELASRVKLASLLFDSVRVEAGALVPADNGMRRLRTRVPGAPAEARSHGFAAVLHDVRVAGCDWATVVAGPMSQRDGGAGELTEDIAADLGAARRLGAALVAGEAVATRLDDAAAAAVARRGAVLPHLGDMPWDAIVELRRQEPVNAVRRLVFELLELVAGPAPFAAVETFEVIAEDIEELLWNAIGDHRPSSAMVFRLAAPAAPARTGTWAAATFSVRDL